MSKLCEIVISDRLRRMGTNTSNVLKKRMTDITKDLLRVATDCTPYKDGGLEQSGVAPGVKQSSSGFSSTVSFGAKGKTYLYAKKMHDGNYKLGERSLNKNSSGVKTIYSDKTFKVGKGYLKETAKACQKGYKKYIEQDVIKDLDRG